MTYKTNIPEYKVFIQVRVNSSRLKNKMLLNFYKDDTILDIILKKLVKKIAPQNIIVATSLKNDDLVFKKLAKKYEVNFFRGSELNVLQRFVDCAEQYNADNIIRVCADNPFLDVELLTTLIENTANFSYDYCSYKINSKPAIKTHFGFFAEATTLSALKKVIKTTSDKYYLEHVTNYLYEQEGFNIKWVEAPMEIQESKNIRLTVDTFEDFNLCASLYSKLVNEVGVEFSYRHILNYINTNEYLKESMKQSIIQNEK